jgi:hypothetical protein
MNLLTYKYYNDKHEQGVGGVLQGEISAYLLSIYFNCSFIRSDFYYYKGHDKNTNKQKWKNLFKFIDQKPSTDVKKIKIIENLNQLKKKSSCTYNIPFEFSQKFLKKISIEDKKRIFQEFRNQFWEHNKNLQKERKIKNIVLHLRNFSRGDSVFGDKSLIYQIFSYDYRLPNNNPKFYSNWYSELIFEIIKKNRIKKKNIQIYICSTGKIINFLEIKKKLEKLGKVKIRLNYSSYDDFKLLISADHFIMAQSSFSYLASLINKNKKYIRNGFRHALSPDVQILKDYQLQNFSFIGYLYNNFLTLLFRIRVKIIDILFKKINI